MSNTHKAFLVAETRLLDDNIIAALEYIGADDWVTSPTGLQQKVSDGEMLVEIMGRLCYKSFAPGLNPNVTKVREGNDVYLGNVLKQKHGSVFEHATTTFVLINVSRIFTHELVRHRAGTAYSQESQRFVRLDNFQLYIPDLTEALHELCPHDPKELISGTIHRGGAEYPETVESKWVPITPDEWVQARQDAFIQMADRIKDNVKDEMSNYLKEIGIDSEGVSFHVKKTITSALRRLLPGGVNTNIGITANHRTWRHLIANRTAFGAEVEIREVFADIGEQLAMRYPNIYQDMQRVYNDNGIPQKIPALVFLNEKI